MNIDAFLLHFHVVSCLSNASHFIGAAVWMENKAPRGCQQQINQLQLVQSQDKGIKKCCRFTKSVQKHARCE